MIIIPRIARKDLNTPFLHVMVQGINKEYIFENDFYINNYLNIFYRNLQDSNITVIAYCIMNNHAHFLMHVENINELGILMHKSNLIYAQFYNNEKKRTGVLFRNRYQTEPIYNLNYLVNCIKYIHENPLRANIVSSCSEYKFSSYNDYINNDGITKTNIMKEIFGSKCDYSKLFRECFDRQFMDIDDYNEKKYYIEQGMQEFMKEESKGIVEIFENRNTFKNLIFFLYEMWGIKFRDIAKCFEITRGAMNELMKR